MNICFIVCFTVSSGCWDTAAGKNLTIQIRMKASISSTGADLLITVKNTGTEMAHGIKAILYIFGQTLYSDTLNRLSVGEHRSFNFEAPLPPLATGRFPVVGEVVFRDTNGRFLSALSAMTIDIMAPPGILLEATAPPITLREKGALTLRVFNRHTGRISCNTRLYLPKGLAALQHVKPVRLNPKTDHEIGFPLENRFCFSGSVYPVYVVLSYTANGRHQTNIVPSLITIENPTNWLKRNRWLLFSGGAFIFGFWITLGVKQCRRRKNHIQS